MHTMTKVFVALAAVLSVALATLAMAYAVNADRIVQEIKGERAARLAAEASAAHDRAVLSTAEQEKALEVERLRKDLDAIRNNLREAQTALTRVEGEKAEAERERDANKGEVALALDTVATQTQLIGKVNDENSRLRDDDIRTRRELVDLTDRLNNIESQRNVLQQNVRALELQIQDLQEQLASVQSGSTLANAGVFGESTGISAPNFFAGTVNSVTTDPGDSSTILQLNLGSNDGVRENMDLYITRNGVFVANVRVFQVDLNHCYGRVLLTNAGQFVNSGDTVQSRLDR